MQLRAARTAMHCASAVRLFAALTWYHRTFVLCTEVLFHDSVSIS